MTWTNHGHTWTHAPAWKVAINTALRVLQSGRQYRWLITTKVDFESLIAGNPKVTGYGFAKVEFRDAS